MADSMIERIARELCAQWSNLDADEVVLAENTGATEQSGTVAAWTLFTERAKAILAAMREPEDGMVDAGFDAERDEDGDMAPRTIWEAMVDEALEGRHRLP
jgi:hypothetical protein